MLCARCYAFAGRGRPAHPITTARLHAATLGIHTKRARAGAQGAATARFAANLLSSVAKMGSPTRHANQVWPWTG